MVFLIIIQRRRREKEWENCFDTTRKLVMFLPKPRKYVFSKRKLAGTLQQQQQQQQQLLG